MSEKIEKEIEETRTLKRDCLKELHKTLITLNKFIELVAPYYYQKLKEEIEKEKEKEKQAEE